MINQRIFVFLPEAMIAVMLLFTACPNDTVPDSYTITYNANGGSGSIAGVTVNEGSTIGLSVNSFTKNNSSFAGWSTTPGGSVEYSDGASFTMGSSDVTLYAQWSVVDYTTLFTDASAGLTGVYRSSSSFSDVDNDGDLDLLITGDKDGGGDSSSILYINDGAGNFTDETSASLQDVYDGFTSFADVDNDGDQDLLITGYTGHIDDKIATLYTNNGTGTFTEVYAGLTGVSYSSSSFTDVDGDGDQDLLITGSNGSSITTTLYINDGDRNFNASSTDLTGVSYGSSRFADVDGDGYQDLLITGYTGSDYISTLYINDGAGNFNKTSAGMLGVALSSSSFADVDNDGDQDLLITGFTSTGSGGTATLYLNGLY